MSNFLKLTIKTDVSFFYHSEQVQNYTLQKVQALKTCCEAKVRKRDESIDETTCCQAEKIWEQMKKGRDCEFQVWRVFLASLSTGRNHPCVEYCPTIRSFPRRRTLLRGGDFLFRHVSIANFELQKKSNPFWECLNYYDIMGQKLHSFYESKYLK